MKRSFIFTILLICATESFMWAEMTAKQAVTEAAKKDTVEESVAFLKSEAAVMTSSADKRSTFIFLAALQEQMNLFVEAQKSYAAAAGIAAATAEGMPKKSNEQLVLDAVRCALSSGDFETADKYLNSAVRNSKNETIQAYIKLYSQWSALCKAENTEELQEPVLMLQAYAKAESMAAVRPAILLTLWYITGENTYSSQIISKYSDTVEAAVVQGEVQLLPTPFWFFVPKMGEAEIDTGKFSLDLPESKDYAKTETKIESKTESKVSKYQLGLFRTEANAKALADEVNKKEFNAYVTSEKRSSGTVYYIVLVNDDSKGNLDDRLRSFGYECYAVE